MNFCTLGKYQFTFGFSEGLLFFKGQVVLDTYRHEQLLYFGNGLGQLDRGTVLGILDGYQDMQVIGQMLPVGLATVGILLKYRKLKI